MTDWQIINIFCRHGDSFKAKDGIYYPLPKVTKSNDPRIFRFGSFGSMCREVWKLKGMGEQEIESRWAEFIDENPELSMTEDVGKWQTERQTSS